MYFILYKVALIRIVLCKVTLSLYIYIYTFNDQKHMNVASRVVTIRAPALVYAAVARPGIPHDQSRVPVGLIKAQIFQI